MELLAHYNSEDEVPYKVLEDPNAICQSTLKQKRKRATRGYKCEKPVRKEAKRVELPDPPNEWIHLPKARIPRYRRRTFEGHSKALTRVIWGASGAKHLLFSSSLDSTVRIWDALRQKECMSILEHHTEGVKDVKCSSDGYVH